MDLSSIYQRRFSPELKFRGEMWQVLCQNFFQKYIPESSILLEFGAGYCEFINNIRAVRKIAVDLNPDVTHYAAPGVETILSSSSHVPMPDGSVDVIFASNFFEHLERSAIIDTIREAHRLLSTRGKFIILQPNIRFCSRDYWMFFDHVTPIDDRALVEVLETNGMKIVEVIPQFLPYSTKSSLPKSIFMIKAYLRLKIAWRIFGKQSLIIASQ
jgi:SAM-dependent methyltransferase